MLKGKKTEEGYFPRGGSSGETKQKRQTQDAPERNLFEVSSN